MKLTYNNVTVDIGYAQYPAKHDTELIQVKERSASGVVYTEDFNVSIGSTTYNFLDMSTEDYVTLMEFFLNEVNGMMEEFRLEDDRGVTSLVKFTTPKLPFTETYLGLWAGYFTVENIQ